MQHLEKDDLIMVRNSQRNWNLRYFSVIIDNTVHAYCDQKTSKETSLHQPWEQHRKPTQKDIREHLR